MPKATTPAASVPKQGLHNNSLSDDLLATGPLRTKSKKRKAKRDDDAGDGFVDSKSSRKILKMGQDMIEEERAEAKGVLPSTAFTFESRMGEGSDTDREIREQDEEPWGDEEDENLEDVVGSSSSLEMSWHLAEFLRDRKSIPVNLIYSINSYRQARIQHCILEKSQMSKAPILRTSYYNR